MVANLMEIEFLELAVRVTATADLREGIGDGSWVPVGFQSMSCDEKMKVSDDTTREQLERLQVAVKECCVVQQTLKSSPPVKTAFIS